VSNHEVLTARSYAGSVFRWLFERKRGLVIRNGVSVDTSKLVPAAVEHRPGTRFVCVVRLTPQKNYLRLVEALRLLADRQEWSLEIWGEGEGRPEIEQAIASSGLGDRIQLRGYSGAVHPEMLWASALILPSLYEGMPNVLTEAMGLGVPVIAADIEGIREVVGKEQACVWIDPLDPHDIAKKISSVLDGEVDLRGLAAPGRLIADRYSITGAQAAYHKLYRDLLRACGVLDSVRSYLSPIGRSDYGLGRGQRRSRGRGGWYRRDRPAGFRAGGTQRAPRRTRIRSRLRVGYGPSAHAN
jgi:glycosyltransferase involved in cell wall biosynthesis